MESNIHVVSKFQTMFMSNSIFTGSKFGTSDSSSQRWTASETKTDLRITAVTRECHVDEELKCHIWMCGNKGSMLYDGAFRIHAQVFFWNEEKNLIRDSVNAEKIANLVIS